MRKKIFSFVLVFSVLLSMQVKAYNSGDSFVLMYHRLSEDAGDLGEYTISPQSLEQDIRYLLDSGYTVCNAESAKQLAEESDRICILTFDDGYSSDYFYALPILEKYGVSATFFVIGSCVGQEGYMTGEMVYHLSQSPHAEVGNHSYDAHIMPYESYKKLADTKPSEIAGDFKKNSSYLGSITKKDIISASYPYGVYNDELDFLLQSYGMTAFSSDEAPARAERSPIPRYNRSNTLTARDIVENKIHSPVKQKTLRYPRKLDYMQWK